MSSQVGEVPAAEPVADRAAAPPRRARRLLAWLRRLRDLFALLGLAALLLVGWLHQQGGRFAADMAPEVRTYLTRAGWDTLRGNLAEALATRVALAEGTTVEAAENAMRTRAAELGLALIELYPRDAPVASAEADSGDAEVAGEVATMPLRAWSACAPEDVAELVSLEPELQAFMPCRVTLYRDPGGWLWLATVDLELLVSGGRAPGDALRRATVRVRDRILDLMAAAGG